MNIYDIFHFPSKVHHLIINFLVTLLIWCSNCWVVQFGQSTINCVNLVLLFSKSSQSDNWVSFPFKFLTKLAVENWNWLDYTYHNSLLTYVSLSISVYFIKTERKSKDESDMILKAKGLNWIDTINSWSTNLT